MTRIYIASAYTKGDVGENIRRQIDAADALMSLGYFPYAPIPATHFQAIVHPRSYEDWMTQDFQWVAVCDVLLRLASESNGADREVKFAQERGIPVVYSIEELREKHPPARNSWLDKSERRVTHDARTRMKTTQEVRAALANYYRESDGITIGIPCELYHALMLELRYDQPVAVPPGECTAPHCNCPAGVCVQTMTATFRREQFLRTAGTAKGYKLVPLELTPDMEKADPYGMGYGRLQAIWNRLLAAAPAVGVNVLHRCPTRGIPCADVHPTNQCPHCPAGVNASDDAQSKGGA